MVLLQSTPKKQTLEKLREHRSLMRGVNLRSNANVLSPSSFQSRKSYLVSAFKDGAFLADPEARGKPRPNPMSDPAAMEGMMGAMKGNVAMMVPQTLIMGWINAFFSGFVIRKCPHTLSAHEDRDCEASVRGICASFRRGFPLACAVPRVQRLSGSHVRFALLSQF